MVTPGRQCTGLEKFNCRRTERNWRAAAGGQRPVPQGHASGMGVAQSGEKGVKRTVLGGGRGAEAESESNCVGMCIFQRPNLF